MTDLLKNASYIKVTHAGQTSGSLFLADLADEENAKQEKKIPVYVPEGGSITLPLDEDVLLSYQQGTIRGFEDQGFLTTTLLDKPSLKPELWVAPDGVDTNPGTREAPYASIQKAVDDLYEQFGHEQLKTVRLLRGEYDEQVIINVRRLELRGENANVFNEGRIVSTASGADIIITNMSKAAVADYIADGGVSYTEDVPTSSFSYTGASLQREIKEGLGSAQEMDITIDRIFCEDMWVLGSPGESGDAVNFQQVRFQDLQVNNSFYGKNTSNLRMDVFLGGPFVLDNCSRPRFYRNRTYTSENVGELFVVRIDNTVDAVTEGVPSNGSFIDPIRRAPEGPFDAVHFYGGAGSNWAYGLESSGPIRCHNNMELMNEAPVGIGAFAEKLDLSVGTLNVKDTATLEATTLLCEAVNKTGSGSFKTEHIRCSGNVTFSGGTSNVINGGIIEGNLTVNAPATVDLTNVTVKGNVTIEAGATLNMNGGGYLGTLTNSGTMNYTALKTATT